MEFLDKVQKLIKFDFCVGTGGNFDELYNLKKLILRKKNGGFLNLKDLSKLISVLTEVDYKARIEKYKLRKDRADVIIPAGFFAKTILVQSESNKFFIPKIGLKEGLLAQLVEETPAP